MDERSDAVLVAAGRDGDRAALAGLVHRHQRRVFATCLGLLGNQADAEDATQEAFVKGIGGLASLRDGRQFAAWITQIARNRCRDMLRQRTRRGDVPLSEGVIAVTPARGPAPDERRTDDFADLRAALDRLPENLRLPLMLFYYDGKSTRKLAEELQLSEGGACVRLYRARRALRQLLEEEADHV
jgi:RNA polymerase sigma-70 factor (ECF subfamily)